MWYSHSKRKLFKMCPYKFKRKYLDGVKFPSIYIMEQGIKCHKLIESYFKEVDVKWFFEVYPDYDLMIQRIYKIIDRYILENQDLSGTSINSLKNFPKFEIARIRGLANDCKDKEEIMEYYLPYSLEGFMKDYDKQVNFVADCIFRRPDGTGAVLDWKTGAASPTKLDSDYRQQGTLYVWRLNEGCDEDGKKLIDIPITHFIVVYLGGLNYNVFREEAPRPRSLKALQKNMTVFYEAVDKGDYPRKWDDSEYGCRGGGYRGYTVEQCPLYQECKKYFDNLDKT